MTSSKLVGVVLRVENPKHLAEWYKNTLGTSIENETSGSSWICEFGINSSSARIKLLQGFGTPYHADKNSVYWKIGLALPDVRSARELILEKGHPAVSEPVQFLNIGYLCHLNDPEGFSIELLQHTFEENFIKSNVVLKPENILGQDCTMGQITLRCSDIKRSLEFYQNIIGMKLLSIQTVEKYGFTLYFLAFTDEVPPESENLHSEQIREWLWQRPYTTLELQHKPGSEIRKMVDEGLGVECIEMKINDYETIKHNLSSAGFTVTSSAALGDTNEKYFQALDPDGAKITFFSAA